MVHAKAGAAALLGAMAGGAQDSRASYNVVLMVVDDLKPTLGVYGDEVAYTPHMDELLGRGMRFENMHSQKPECAPSRASMVTGRMPDGVGVLGFNEDFRRSISDKNTVTMTWPEALQDQHGYLSEAMGKIVDNRNFPNSHADMCKNGDTSGCSWQYIKIPKDLYDEDLCEGSKPALRWPTRENDVGQDKENKQDYLVWEFDDELSPSHIDHCVAHNGISMLRRMADGAKNGGQPFFLGLGFAKPHMPFTASTVEFDMYRQVPDHAVEPPSVIHTHSNNVGDVDFWSDNNAEAQVPASDEMKSYGERNNNNLDHISVSDRTRAYYASTSFVDRQIGAFMEVFDNEIDPVVRDNTMIVLWGDHGFHLGEYNVWGKKTVLEHATRVPCGIVLPKAFVDLPENQQIKDNLASGDLYTLAPAQSTDISSTVFDVLGFTNPNTHTSGTSLLPLFRDPESSVRLASVSQYESYGNGRPMGYSVRTKYHRLVVYMDRKNGKIENLNGLDGNVQIYRYVTPGNYELIDLGDSDAVDAAQYAEIKEQLLDLVRPGGQTPDADWTHLITAADLRPFDHDFFSTN